MLNKTRVSLSVALFSLLTVLPLHAQDTATLGLRSGVRAVGELQSMNAGGVVLRENGADRTYPLNDIRSIEFLTEQWPEAQNRMGAGRPFVVLRSREAFEGRLIGMEDHRPIRLTFDIGGGTRQLSFAEIAQVWVNPAPVAAAQVSEAAAPPAGSIMVPANVAWTDTGIPVTRNARIRFTAGGDIILGPNMSSGIGGSPAVTVAGARYPVRGAFAGALIGRIGNGDPFLIGANQEPIQVRGTGRLFLGVNDDVLVDNSGAYHVTVTMTR